MRCLLLGSLLFSGCAWAPAFAAHPASVRVWTSPGCGPCQAFWRDLRTDAEFERAFRKKYSLTWIDADAHSVRARLGGIRSLPTFEVCENGRCYRVEGYATPEQLAGRLGFAIVRAPGAEPDQDQDQDPEPANDPADGRLDAVREQIEQLRDSLGDNDGTVDTIRQELLAQRKNLELIRQTLLQPDPRAAEAARVQEQLDALVSAVDAINAQQRGAVTPLVPMPSTAPPQSASEPSVAQSASEPSVDGAPAASVFRLFGLAIPGSLAAIAAAAGLSLPPLGAAVVGGRLLWRMIQRRRAREPAPARRSRNTLDDDVAAVSDRKGGEQAEAVPPRRHIPPRELDELHELVRLGRLEGRNALLDAAFGMFADDEFGKLLDDETAPPDLRAAVARIKDQIEERVNAAAPLSIPAGE